MIVRPLIVTGHALLMIFLCATGALSTVHIKYVRIVTSSFKLFDRPLSEHKIRENSMSKKPICWEPSIPKNGGLSRLSMSRMLISNLSQLLGTMTKCFNCNRTFVKACESRRNQYQELPFTATIILDVICKTKRTLRINTLVVTVTVGLPKSQKRYGNGGLIVVGTKTRVFSNTFKECEVI